MAATSAFIAAKRSRPKAAYLRTRDRWGLLFVLPTVLFFAIFYIFPILSGFYLSLTDFNLLRAPRFIGLDNFEGLLSDRLFQRSIIATLGFVAGSTVPVWILSLLAAKLFFQRFPGRELLRLVFISPLLPSLVVVSIIWRVLFHPNGVMTWFAGSLFGLGEIRWLNDVALSPVTIIVANAWTTIPFYMLIWLAGLSGIPEEMRDAARVDGANSVQFFWHIELPLLRPTAIFVAAISTINAFQGFTLQYIISPNQGGPVDVNTTLGLLIWKLGFQYFKMGEAAAASVVLFIIILLVTVLQLAWGRSRDYSLQ
jgi:multiple sugar transport system permease protein